MIKIKITQNGGYVVGDGPCPFDPDEFMAAYMDKIIEARRAGLTEIGVPDDVIDEMKQKAIADLAAAPVKEIPDEAVTNVASMLDALDMAPLQIPERFDDVHD